jgi:hypothetical protein
MATRYGTYARLKNQRRRTLSLSPKRCALMAAWMDGDSPNASKIFAVPITRFQSDVLRSLAAHRSPDSYIPGGVAINREGPRYSADIDIFHDSEARPESAARTDATVLTAEGYIVVPGRTREATVSRGDETMQLEWVKFSGVTPEEMLAEITRHSRFTIEKFQALATEQPIDVPRLHRRIRSMIEDAESFIARLPSDAVGVIFMEVRERCSRT